MIEAFGVTERGLRHRNEDAFGSFPELGLFVVADGMGGMLGAATEGAELVVSTTRAAYAAGERSSRGLAAALEAAHIALRERIAQDRRWIGTGACVVALALAAGDAHVAHAGDCRLYRLRDQETDYRGRRRALERLTEDHSLLNELLRTRRLTAEEIAKIPRNVVTRALGIAEGVAIEKHTEPARPGDLYLLTTDGLHGTLGDDRIADSLRTAVSVRGAISALVASATEARATDNITGLIVRV